MPSNEWRRRQAVRKKRLAETDKALPLVPIFGLVPLIVPFVLVAEFGKHIKEKSGNAKINVKNEPMFHVENDERFILWFILAPVLILIFLAYANCL